MNAPVSYSHPAVRQDWLDLVKEETFDPASPVVDPHHHFFDPGGKHSALPYLLREMASDFGAGHRVVGRVYVQAGWRLRPDGNPAFRPVGETEAATDLARISARGGHGPVASAIVSYADLRDPDLLAILDAHLQAGGGYVRGIRQSAALDPHVIPLTTVVPPPLMLRAPEFVRGLRLLGSKDLVYDSFQYHPQLGDLLFAARAAPETTIVIDHTGGPLRCGPYRTDERQTHSDWLAGMRALAACPNVLVKLGGLGMAVNAFNYHEAAVPPTSDQLAEDWRPWFVPCIELFGARRCMFESNFPVDKSMFGYTVLWNAFKKIVASASAEEKSAMLSETAWRTYRLDESDLTRGE